MVVQPGAALRAKTPVCHQSRYMMAREMLRAFRQSEPRKGHEPKRRVGRPVSLAAELGMTMHDGFGVTINLVPDGLAETATAIHCPVS